MLETLAFDRHHLHRAYAEGLAPTAVLDECRRRIAAADDPGIFLHEPAPEAVAAAAAALPPFDPEHYPLWGLPFAVKDNIDVAGSPTTAACPAFAYAPAADAEVVRRLAAAGAVCVGKTNLDQFATGLVGVRTPYPIPRNALDPTIVPGGSSSGSAVAVARGLVSFALGTDTAGSGRVPAALNNIVGLKPSLGALSTRGVVPACRTLDCVSVFATTVDDAWAVHAAAAAFDEADPFSRHRPARSFGPAPESFRLGVPSPDSRHFFGDQAQAAMFQAAIESLQTLGAACHDIDFTLFYETAALLYEGAWVAERLAAIESFIAEAPEALHPTTRTIIEGARSLGATEAFKGFYRLAELRRRLEPVLDTVDMLVVPSIPGFVTLDEIAADPIGPNSRLGTYTNFVNLLDLAAITVPTGPRDDGRPGSVTLLAKGGEDGRIASVARALHHHAAPTLGATGRTLDRTAPPAPAAADDAIELVVVGAHMRDMALNGELLAAGGRFCRSVSTAPTYRLWALTDSQPPRPGLLRTTPEDPLAGAIEAELWTLPPDGFGRLVAAVPAPLSIGTLELADGTVAKGFLVEAIGTRDARDITSLGGWRQFCAQTS